MSSSDFTDAELGLILSALDDTPRSPATRGEAMRAIQRSSQRFGLMAEDVLAAAAGLLDGHLSPAEFRDELHDLAGTEPLDEAPFLEITDAPQPARGAQEGSTRR